MVLAQKQKYRSMEQDRKSRNKLMYLWSINLWWKRQDYTMLDGEGNGNPLQYSCLENPVYRGGWWALVHRVAQSQTRLKRFSMHACTGEGNGNPLQCSCLENLRDGEAWWAAVCGVAQSRTRLKRLSSSSSDSKINTYRQISLEICAFHNGYIFLFC